MSEGISFRMKFYGMLVDRNLEKPTMTEKTEEKLRPTRNLVLCRTAGKKGKPAERKSKGGIHLPETARGREDRAEVLAVGEGWYTAKGILVECCVKPGDVVIFNPYRVEWAENVDMAVNSKAAKPGELFLIHDNEILAVVE